MSWVAVATIGGSLLSSSMGGAPSTSTQQQQTAYAPFSSQYANYQPMLQNLVSNPSSVTSTPGYQFNLSQGETAVNQGMASEGLLGSGNQAAALTQYGQNYATSQYQTQLQNLMSLSGVGVNQNGSPTTNSANQTAAGGALLGGTLANLLTGGGGSTVAGTPGYTSTGQNINALVGNAVPMGFQSLSGL